MSLLNKEPVKRAEKALKEFDETLSVTELENTARTALDAAKSLNCEVGAVSYTHLTLPTNREV